MDVEPFRFLHPHSGNARPLVAISACLTGAAVRYDGTDKYQPGIDRWLHDQIELLPICPELDAGLGVPRPPVQLISDDISVRVIGRDDRTLDVTTALTTAAAIRCNELYTLPLCGYLWKSRSPSCGLGSTPLFNVGGEVIGIGDGLQAQAVTKALPWLVMAEEETLQREAPAQQFLLGCRVVFDCLHAEVVTAQQIADHYRSTLAAVTGGDRALLQTACDHNDRHALAALLIKVITA